MMFVFCDSVRKKQRKRMWLFQLFAVNAFGLLFFLSVHNVVILVFCRCAGFAFALSLRKNNNFKFSASEGGAPVRDYYRRSCRTSAPAQAEPVRNIKTSFRGERKTLAPYISIRRGNSAEVSDRPNILPRSLGNKPGERAR